MKITLETMKSHIAFAEHCQWNIPDAREQAQLAIWMAAIQGLYLYLERQEKSQPFETGIGRGLGEV